MLLPQDLLSGTYTRPRLFLCETDKSKICQLDAIEMKASLKFNSYSVLEVTIGRTYEDIILGKTLVNPYYDKIEALRLLYLEGFGYFEIQDPEIVSDGIMEVKNVTANSLEYNLSQKYLENFYINTGETGSVEVSYAEDNNLYDTNGNLIITPVSFYNISNPNLSLWHLIQTKMPGWTVGHIDESLKTMTRSFDISRASVYDFIMQDICDKFNCFAVFNTIENKISFYEEALTAKFEGDGARTIFTVLDKFPEIGRVTIGGYTTTIPYEYNQNTGVLTFSTPPAKGAMIVVTDGAQLKWETDVFVTFENLAQEVNISYSADDIKTVLTVKGADDLNIREVNMGLPYITDLSYYHTIDWMGQDLYDAYTAYVNKCESKQEDYQKNAAEILEINNYIKYEENRLSLRYSIASHVNNQTVGTYYVRGGTSPNYYYKEVQLPSEYNAEVENYYSLSGNDLNELKVSRLYAAIQEYYVGGTVDQISELEADFAFMEDYTIDSLVNDLSSTNSTEEQDTAVKTFFDEMWNQVGLTPLKTLYYASYQQVQRANIEAGWDKSDEYYWRYYPVTLILASIEKEMEDREATISQYEEQAQPYKDANIAIGKDIEMSNNFTQAQLIRLSPFLREDEYTDDTFVITDADSIEITMQVENELLKSGRIELSKLCEPKLSFSMDMANIFALKEFAPIIHQFELGRLINVVLRSDYIKRARLLQVDINFNDFSDFSCEFGELTDPRTQSSIHADLLSQALTAGKSVASNESYWNKGADLATSTDIKIQQGLIGATGGLYNSDQSVTIDDNGILLRKVNPDGSFSPNQAWLTNNTILLSSDSFKTSRVGLGEFTIDGTTFYGILAEAVLSGYIEGSTIVGGTINIGDGTFVVNSDGSVVMKATSIDGYVEEDNVISSINQSAETIAINANKISLTGKEINLTSDDISITSDNFSVDKDGNITATSGDIAGWVIKPDALVKDLRLNDTDYQMYLQSPNATSLVNAFAVRTKSTSSETWDMQFSVDYTGKLTAKNANITGAITATSLALGSGVTIPYSKLSNTPDLDVYIAKDGTVGATPTNGSTGFKVSSDGLLTASNAVIYGTIYASNGEIAGWTVDSNSIRYGTLGGGASMWLVRSGSTSSASIGGSDEISGWCIGVSNTFGVTKNGKLYATGAEISGKITASSGSIGSWTIGDMGSYTDSIYTTYCATSTPSSSNPEYAVFMRGTGSESNIAIGVKKRTSSSTAWTDADTPFYVRKDGYVKMSDVHADGGTIGGWNIGLSKIYGTSDSGNVAVMQLPTDSTTFVFAAGGTSHSDYSGCPFRVTKTGELYATKAIISGDSIIEAACIPNLDASKITSGTISTTRLDSSVITTGNFSSKSLSTGNLNIQTGCVIGSATYNATIDIRDGYVYIAAAGPTSYGTTIHEIVRQAVENGSNRDIKNEIHDFDDRYDVFFDNLNPQLYKYNFDESSGYSMGYIWQETEEALISANLTKNDVGAIYESAAVTGGLGLRKTDFISLNTWQIQKLKARVEELETRLAALGV